MKIKDMSILVIMVLAAGGCSRSMEKKNVILKTNAFPEGKAEVSTEADPRPHPMEISVAVLNFRNNSANADWEFMETALPDLVSADMGMSDGFKMVERTRIADVLKELHLGSTGAVEPATALKIGKLIGANVLVLGSVTQLGKKIILTARIVKTQSGEIVGGIVQEGTRIDELPALAHSSAERITYAIHQQEEFSNASDEKSKGSPAAAPSK